MREYLLEELKREIIGPGLSELPHTNHPYADTETGEEILLVNVHGHPTQRYGAGILFPMENIFLEDSLNEKRYDVSDGEDFDETGLPTKEEVDGSQESIDADEEEDTLIYTNQSRPSAMGLTIQCKSEGFLSLEIQSAYYELMKDFKNKWTYDKDIEKFKERDYSSQYYIRRPIKLEPLSFDLSEIKKKGLCLDKVLFQRNGTDWIKLRIYNRTSDADLKKGILLLTFSLLNVIDVDKIEGGINGCSLFQNELSISDNGKKVILPYKEKFLQNDPEMDQMNLLYRKKKAFGIGHGCAATWDQIEDNSVSYVKSSFLPNYEIPQIASNEDASISMYNISDICNGADWESGKAAMIIMAENYGNWIENLVAEINCWQDDPIMDRYRLAALVNIGKCKLNHIRIKKGVDLITKVNPNAHEIQLIRCFRWMNRAMLWQQQRSRLPTRKWKGPINNINVDNFIISDLREVQNSDKGRWRPFQLAFVLMNIEAIWDDTSEDRGILDLIWFPTGGGKTEAYLGLTAFQIFVRRIRNIVDWTYDHLKYSGTVVLMRYTLRLLTIQQYERAASLICACEFIRKEQANNDLGTDPISIGLWVGSDSTPNENAVAVNRYNALCANYNQEYNFIVMKCPCCGAQIGKLDNELRYADRLVRGINIIQGKVRFKCEDPLCETSNWDHLPMYVVDEEIFAIKPTLLISTVDKFAMITWKAGKEAPNNELSRIQAGTLFGFRYDAGTQIVTRILPPQLIIQDELHLISGPLGTVVGLYETMVQTLCNNYGSTIEPFITQDGKPIPPKIIASSATISRAPEQVKNLYGISQDRCNIFPPQGIEFGETWFSRIISTNEAPGRTYVGVLAPAYRSIQTAETRVYSRLLQSCKSKDTTPSVKDPYWTLVGFFNSLRGLGSASTLVNSDISQYLKTLFNRELIIPNARRYPRSLRFMELTSRIDDSEIPMVLKRLEAEYVGTPQNAPLDICMATNMIATGVDVPRLGLMVVHGQPKTTAEYIQASSRVGREVQKDSLGEFTGQGLVVTIYSPNKPRDKSHYEQFQSYHSRIYASVEPTSVTPFSINARHRALYAVFIGLVRQLSGGILRYRADGGDFDSISNLIKNLIVNRCELIDPIESQNVEFELDALIRNWNDSGIQFYGDAYNTRIPDNRVLMYAPSAPMTPGYLIDRNFFPKPAGTSMRGVDQESELRFFY